MHKRPALWYKDAIIYELNIKGFYDSNNDGIGDFAGLEQKLDYLQDLGVTAIWLLPFYPSPLRDDGYDIADYYSIREAYGTIDDFKRFLDEAHRRDLYVITELVINHTSDQHPWFQRARRAPAGSPERDYYVWSDNAQKYKDVRIIFQDFEASNWAWDERAGAYFWHRFYSHQPDLNFDNPVVQEEIFRILDFWADMGIDGFRLDAIPYLFEREGTNCENLPETHVFLKKLRNHLETHHDNVLFLAEANMWPEDSASYFGDGDECHMNYHFPLMPRMYMSVKMEDRHPITDIFDQTPAIPDNCQWATFLRNHDELTLEMVTDEERDFMYQVYAKDRTARINLGIRRRLAPLMDNDRNKIELLNILLLSLPGTPVLYYGDEIGMGDNFYLGDRDGVRTPMQWDSGENAGFSDANPQQLYLPVIRDPEYSYRSVNVKRQQQNQNSLWWWTKRVLAKRKQYRLFGRGDIEFLTPENGKVLAFTRSYEGQTMLVVVNLSRYAEAVQLDLSGYQGHRVREVFGRRLFPEVQREPYLLSLSPFGYYWLELEAAETGAASRRTLGEPAFAVNEIDELVRAKGLRQLAEGLLPEYLKASSWFGPRAQNLESVQVQAAKMLTNGGRRFGWLLLQIHYTEGLPEFIQLPLAFYRNRQLSEFAHEDEVIGVVALDDQPLVIRDAIYSDTFRHYLMQGLQNFASTEGFTFRTTAGRPTFERQEVTAVHTNAEYVQLQYPEVVVKFYRRLHVGQHPDQAMKRALRELDFVDTPELWGELTYRTADGQSALVASFAERITVQGSAWDYVLDQFQRLTDELLGHYEQLKNEPVPEIDITDEMHYRGMPLPLQEMVGTAFIHRLANLGRVTAAMHKTLARSDHPDFGPEPLSLHYQRSLFAGLKSKVRESFTLLRKHGDRLPEEDRQAAQDLLKQEGEVLEKLKQVFDHKIEAVKIRTHGDYTLEQLGVQGESFVVLNFDGDPELPASQRRLRRSPVKDLANMMRSLAYAYRITWRNQLKQVRPEQETYFYNWLHLAYRCFAAEFLTHYRQEVADTELLPTDEEDLRTLLTTFRIEKTLQEIRYDLQHRPEWAFVPIRGLLSLLRR